METMLSLFLIVSILFGTGCQNTITQVAESQTESQNQSNPLGGSWLWVQTSGGFAGIKKRAEDTGKVELWSFSGDGVFTKTINGTVELETSYSIADERSMIYRDTRSILTIEGMRYVITISSDGLSLQEDVYDGFAHEFSRNR